MQVTGSQLITDQAFPGTKPEGTTWRAIWDALWYYLATRFHRQSHTDEPFPQQGGDRWASTWQSFPFKIATYTIVIEELRIYPLIPERDPHLRLWLHFRLRLINAHRYPRLASYPSVSTPYSFLYLLGLEGEQPEKRRTTRETPLRQHTPMKARLIRKAQQMQQRPDLPRQEGLWDQDT